MLSAPLNGNNDDNTDDLFILIIFLALFQEKND